MAKETNIQTGPESNKCENGRPQRVSMYLHRGLLDAVCVRICCGFGLALREMVAPTSEEFRERRRRQIEFPTYAKHKIRHHPLQCGCQSDYANGTQTHRTDRYDLPKFDKRAFLHRIYRGLS